MLKIKENGKVTNLITESDLEELGGVNVLISNQKGLEIGTTAKQITVPFDCPKPPKAIIPYADGGAPFYCSVISWTQTSVLIAVKATESLANRTVVVVVIY